MAPSITSTDDKVATEARVTPVNHDPEMLKGVKPGQADMALKMYEIDVDPAEIAAVDEKKLLWKIDMALLPIMFIAITIFTLDKATLSYSSIMGIQEDTHLTKDQYAWLGSIFSLGYLLANFPCAVIIQKVPLSKWVVTTMSIWGVLLACMAAGKNFGHLFAIRLLLGFFEASITPVFVVMTGMWYKRSEQPKRLGIWYAGVGFATIIGSPIAWALEGHKHTEGGLKSWQLLYVVTGAMTVFLAIVFFFLVPDSPLTAWFLSPAERRVAVERIRVNQQGIGNRKFKVNQAIEFLMEPRTYLYLALQFISNVGYGAVGTFGSLLIVSMGYSEREALIITLPHGVTTLVGVVFCCYMANKMNDRTLWAVLAAFVGVICGACLYALPKGAPGLIGAYHVQHVFVATYILNFSLVAANTAGHTKKVLTNAILLVGSTTGSLSGPQLTKNDPSYGKVKLVMCIAPAFAIVILCVIRVINTMENRRRDRAGEGAEAQPDQAFLDLTDRENRAFRYQM